MSEATPSGKRILVIDDAEVYTRLVCDIFGIYGYSAKGVYTVADALECLQQEHFDFLVTGCNNHRRADGVHLANEARRRWPGLQIVMVTGSAPESIPTSVDVLIDKSDAFPRLLEEIDSRIKSSTPPVTTPRPD